MSSSALPTEEMRSTQLFGALVASTEKLKSVSQTVRAAVKSWTFTHDKCRLLTTLMFLGCLTTPTDLSGQTLPPLFVKAPCVRFDATCQKSTWKRKPCLPRFLRRWKSAWAISKKPYGTSNLLHFVKSMSKYPKWVGTKLVDCWRSKNASRNLLNGRSPSLNSSNTLALNRPAELCCLVPQGLERPCSPRPLPTKLRRTSSASKAQR